MKSKKFCSRKISATEVDNDFIFILKSKLSFFPDLGEEFVIVNDNISREVKIESYPCTCRGPDRPHDHYFIRWKDLEPGDKIEIIQDSKKSNKYHLKITSPIFF